jgi:OFA family oxalate/formate antiporter-like MFS transporter
MDAKKNEEGLRQLYRFRRIMLLMALLVMMIISIYQYSWSLFAFALARELKWSLATLGLTFTVFAYSATFIQPFSGYVADTFGPRKVSILAAVLVGLGFLLSSRATTPMEMHVFYGLGSVGVGILYGLSTASAIKWFPEKRGFATGLVVFGFGAGTALFNWVIQQSLDLHGFRATFLYLGLFMLAILVPAAFFFKYPPADWKPSSGSSVRKAAAPAAEFRPSEMLRTYQWFLIYFCFSFTVSIVLMFGAQMKMLAKEYRLPPEYFNILLVLFPLGNGLSRVVAGAVSDWWGREKTMMVFYGLLGLSIIALLKYGDHAAAFVAIVFIAALLGGAPFALYPATVGDYYGPKYSTVNYGITYTAKAWAGFISGWLSGYFVAQSGSYRFPLVLIAICSLVAAVVSNPKWMKAPRQRP